MFGVIAAKSETDDLWQKVNKQHVLCYKRHVNCCSSPNTDLIPDKAWCVQLSKCYCQSQCACAGTLYLLVFLMPVVLSEFAGYNHLFKESTIIQNYLRRGSVMPCVFNTEKSTFPKSFRITPKSPKVQRLHQEAWFASHKIANEAWVENGVICGQHRSDRKKLSYKELTLAFCQPMRDPAWELGIKLWPDLNSYVKVRNTRNKTF